MSGKTQKEIDVSDNAMDSGQTPVVTEIFRMGKQSHAMHMVHLHGKPWMALMSCLAVASLICGIFIDTAWSVVFLMMVFIVFPAILAYLYFFYGLIPESAMNVAPHRLIFHKDSISSEIYALQKTAPEATEEEDEKRTENPIHILNVPLKSVESLTVGISSVTLSLKGKGAFIWIPVDAFPSEDLFKMAIQLSTRYLKHSPNKTHPDNQK